MLSENRRTKANNGQIGENLNKMLSFVQPLGCDEMPFIQQIKFGAPLHSVALKKNKRQMEI